MKESWARRAGPAGEGRAPPASHPAYAQAGAAAPVDRRPAPLPGASTEGTPQPTALTGDEGGKNIWAADVDSEKVNKDG